MTVIVPDLVSKINKSYYPQILVEEYIYKEKDKKSLSHRKFFFFFWGWWWWWWWRVYWNSSWLKNTWILYKQHSSSYEYYFSCSLHTILILWLSNFAIYNLYHKVAQKDESRSPSKSWPWGYHTKSCLHDPNEWTSAANEQEQAQQVVRITWLFKWYSVS